MKTILITGSAGFIGKNLRAHLSTRADIRILEFDIGKEKTELEASAREAEFIFHLAGVNRPKDPGEFETGNRGLTENLVTLLEAAGRKVPVLISSSIQAAIDNPYGKSKLGAEQAVHDYGKQTGAPTYIFRLPNVFGKWCRPNYNSVVATWCFNTANGLPIQVNDPRTELSLVYIDDVAAAFIAALEGRINPERDGFCRVETVYTRSLGSIAETLQSFVASRKTLVLPPLEDAFVRRLYGTWLSYLPEDGFGYSLQTRQDTRGWLAEFLKSSSFGQIFVSTTKPGITRGNHWHHTKVEKFLVVSGSAMIRFRRIDGTKVLEYPVRGDDLRVVDIPVGYTHSITNVGDGDLVTLFWADEVFDPARPDTTFLEV